MPNTKVAKTEATKKTKAAMIRLAGLVLRKVHALMPLQLAQLLRGLRERKRAKQTRATESDNKPHVPVKKCRADLC